MKDQKATATEPSVYIIAEIGTSHNGSLSRASALINAAAEAGADCVKTQVVFADEIIHPNTGAVELPGGMIRLYDRFLELEQNFEFYRQLKEMTEAAGLDFLASPFGIKSFDWLNRLGCNSIKIASPELNHLPLLEYAAASGKKLMLSTGVSTLEDIAAALSVTGTDKTILFHCITSYPAPVDEYNLRVINTLNEIFAVPVGISDHSTDALLVPGVAAAVGACCIEKHFTLDKNDGGLDDPIALTPAEFRRMTEIVREIEDFGVKSDKTLDMLRARFGTERIETVLGSGIKELAPSETANYGLTNRSVHALTDLTEGTVLSLENTALLRTEKKLRPGLRPEFYSEILGKKLVRPVESGQGIVREDIGYS